MCNIFGGGCSWIIILVLVFLCCGNGFGGCGNENNCGCNNNCGCGGNNNCGGGCGGGC